MSSHSTASTLSPFLDAFTTDWPRVRLLKPASDLLDSLGYEGNTRLRILQHAHQWGSVQCCALLTKESHRDEVEKLLPEAEPYEWAKHDAFVWEPNLDPSIVCECEGASLCANCVF